MTQRHWTILVLIGLQLGSLLVVQGLWWLGSVRGPLLIVAGVALMLGARWLTRRIELN
jgi:hypothetical protein